MLKRILKFFALFLVLLLAIGLGIIFFSGPDLPKDADQIIREVASSPFPELKGEQGYAKNGDISIWYEKLSPPDSVPVKGSVLLIMGIANDALAWPDYFLDPFLENGYQLIRFDNRGTGMSDWVKNWQKEGAYTLEDMAADGLAVLNELDIGKAHILGVSLGGMIAQSFVIQYPDRSLSLISMMSSGNITDPELPGINTKLIRDLVLVQLKYGLNKSAVNEVKLQLASRYLLMGEARYELDVRGVAESVLYNLYYRNGYNPEASPQQMAATISSGSRYEKLRMLSIRTLVIHGKSDPIIPFVHGQKVVRHIPEGDSLWVENMGHDIPKAYLEPVLEKIFSHLEKSKN